MTRFTIIISVAIYSIKLLIENICLGLITEAAFGSVFEVSTKPFSLITVYLHWFDHITDYCHVKWLLLLELTK